MATKGIRITNENVKRLEQDYGMDDDDLKPNIGFWMIVQFGSTAIDGFLSDSSFLQTFDVLEPLENRWFDISLKETVG